jgi:hypothetical protein
MLSSVSQGDASRQHQKMRRDTEGPRKKPPDVDVDCVR